MYSAVNKLHFRRHLCTLIITKFTTNFMGDLLKLLVINFISKKGNAGYKYKSLGKFTTETDIETSLIKIDTENNIKQNITSDQSNIVPITFKAIGQFDQIMYKPDNIDINHLHNYPVIKLLLIDNIMMYRLSSLSNTNAAFIGAILEINKKIMQTEHKKVASK